MRAAQHILYVEDNAMLRATVFDYLEMLGHHVQAVSNAEAALGALAQSRYDVLITDASLPGRSGLELIQDAVQMQPTLHLILASGHDLVDEAAQLGFPVRLLAKPFDLDALENVIEARIL
ncbi:MAG TPA: response regulator [Chitinolyticbacter sp.]|nr:response regulator [Chitinolyticbacter sp.]